MFSTPYLLGFGAALDSSIHIPKRHGQNQNQVPVWNKVFAERSFVINRTTLFNGKTLPDPILTNNEADATEAEKKESVDRRERERGREDKKGERDTSWERVRFLA